MNTIKYEEFPKRISTYVKQTNFPIKQVDKQKGLNHWLGNFLFRGHTIEVKISATHLGNYVLSVLIDGCWPPWWVPVDTKTVGQFTSLTDVNGEDIYEGDLVRLTDDLEDPIYKVIFDEAKFEIIGGGVCYDLGEEFMDCEVIGNVHTNPELLEEDE